MSLTALDLVLDFMADFESELKKEKSPYMDNVVQLLVQMLRLNQSQTFLSHLLAVIRSFLYCYSELLFKHQYTAAYTLDLTFELIRLCNEMNDITRREASALLYLFLRVNSTNPANPAINAIDAFFFFFLFGFFAEKLRGNEELVANEIAFGDQYFKVGAADQQRRFDPERLFAASEMSRSDSTARSIL
jgi:hypothetical protein